MIDKERLDAYKPILRLHLDEIQEPSMVHAFYLVAAMTANTRWDYMLDLHDDQEIHQLLFDCESFMWGYLEENFKDGYKNEDDLFSVMNTMAGMIFEKEKIHQISDNEHDYVYTALIVAFRMWYEKKGKEDLLYWIEHPESDRMPDTSDYSLHFKWAKEQGIKCTDMASVFDSVSSHKSTAEEEIEGLQMMADYKKFFTGLVEAMEPCRLRTFIQENDKSCFLLFMFIITGIGLFSPHDNLEEVLADDKKFDEMYKTLLKILLDKTTLKDEISIPEKAADYKQVVLMSLMILNHDIKNGNVLFGGVSRDEFAEAATEERINRVEGKTE